MTIQVTVRLPDDLVHFADEQVSTGAASSRAAVVAKALARERRRLVAMRDAEIYAAAGPDPDADSLAAYAASLPMDDD